jgi:hypothetical protein
MLCEGTGIRAASNLSIEATPKRSAEAAGARGRRVMAARRPATAMRRSVTGGGTGWEADDPTCFTPAAELDRDVLPFAKAAKCPLALLANQLKVCIVAWQESNSHQQK